MSNYQQQLPDQNRLSILVSIILLSYTLTHFVSIPTREYQISLLGVYFPLKINFSTMVSLLVAGMTASGSAWLLQDHPTRDQKQTTAVHWLLPSLTSLVLMLAVEQIPFGITWWLAAFSSGLILIMVYTAEYIVLESSNDYFPIAQIGITALSIVLFLVLAIALHLAEVRLFFRVPLLSFAAALVYIRIVHLRQDGLWAISQGSVAFLLIGEIAAGLHYWPLNSISYGLALTGPLYSLLEVSEFIPAQTEDLQWKSLLWPGLILLISWGAAIMI
jgi:hypothetical protein